MKAIYELIERVLPNHKKQIVCELCDSHEGKDVYEIDWVDSKLVLKGNNYISLAAALGWYLKYDAKVNISWCGSNKKLPASLPKATKYRRVIEQKYRVYMNYCTFNYTASWWEFERWEKEIDFMALNGINMPLTVVGIEACWYETLLEFGFSDEEARSFLAGPAFLAWQWMGNLEGFGGPLPMNWIQKRIKLGKQILDRIRSLGMQPIQQGFSGVVPRLLKEKYPDSKMEYQKSWNGFEETVQLDPTDPLFQKMGMVFLQKQKEIFGAYGYYAADPFHEGKPPVEGSAYLREVGKSINRLYKAFDKNATWVMQAWSIREEIVTSVPKDSLLVLDLASNRRERNNNYWGYDFVAGNLHNFGGRIKLHGDVKYLAQNEYRKIVEEGHHVVGTGLFMEGIEQNPMYYDLAFEMLTRGDVVDLDEWIEGYIQRRYGKADENARKAWDILIKTVYSPGTNYLEKGSVICTRPAVHLKKTGPGPGFLFPYGEKRLYEALQYLSMADCDTDGYQFDLVDVLRQYLSDYAYGLYTRISKSYLNRETEVFAELTGKYLELLDDMDKLLSIRPEYSFEKWVKDAISWGETEEESKLYEYNAASLLTVWGEEDNSILFDYAWREWSGLISSYYKKRFVMFFAMLKECLDNDTEWYEEHLEHTVDDRISWKANEFYSEMADMEVEWLHQNKTFSCHSIEDSNAFIQSLIQKYAQ